jgi:4-hydroxybenzoate polyprenyltransferase
MDRNSPLISRYLAYSKERFPLPGVMLYAGTLYYACFLFPRTFAPATAVPWGASLAGYLVLILVFFHLRVLDEHKDYHKDRLAYPERLLSRGVVSLTGLRTLMSAALAIEAGVSVSLGLSQTLLWLAILLWSLLMYREFFVPRWLNAHLGVYLVSHQALAPLMGLYAVNQAIPLRDMTADQHLRTAVLLVGVTCLTITYEIARKTWSKDREHEQADSYTKVWGVGRTLLTTQAVALAGALALVSVSVESGFRPGQTALTAVFVTLLGVAHLQFLRNPVRRASKRVEAAGALCMLGIFCVSAIAFGLSHGTS